MENECEALPGVAYPGVRDNRSTLNTKTGYDDKQSQEFSDLSRDFNCIIDVFSVVELKCVLVHLVKSFIEFLNLYF